MKARIRKVSASVDSATFDFKPSNDLTSFRSDVDHAIENRIDKKKKFINSPLIRQKSGSSTSPERVTKTNHKIFGTPIEIILNLNLNKSPFNSDIPKNDGVPFVVKRLCHFIKDNSGFLYEGLFRTSGNAKLIEKLKSHFDTFGDAPLESEGDIPSAAALLKLFLRELPVPLIPYRFHSSFLEIFQDKFNQTFFDNEAILNRLKTLVEQLPNENYCVLKYLSIFLNQVALNEAHNRMTPSSLGIIFGPNIFRVTTNDYKSLQKQALTNQVVTFFIVNNEQIFSKVKFKLNLNDNIQSLVSLSVEIPSNDLKETALKLNMIDTESGFNLETNSQKMFLTTVSLESSPRKEANSSPDSFFLRSNSEKNILNSYQTKKELRKCRSFEDVFHFSKNEKKFSLRMSSFSNISPLFNLEKLNMPQSCLAEQKLKSNKNETGSSFSIENKVDFLKNFETCEDELKNDKIESTFENRNQLSYLPPLDLKTLHQNEDGKVAIASEPKYDLRLDNNCWPSENLKKDYSFSYNFQTEFSQLNVENVALKMLKKDELSFEAPLSPSAYRDFIGQKGASTDDTIPPSPPIEQIQLFQPNEFKFIDKNRALKELKNKLKKKIKQMENDFEKKYGCRPSQEQKMKSPAFKPLILELNRLRKNIKEIKEESYLENKLDVYEVLFEMQKRLKQRTNVGQPDLIEVINDAEVLKEKLDFQKCLLKYESIFGRPTNRQDRTIMKPIYDCYRTVKRLMAKIPKVRKDSSNLAPILENVAMNFYSPTHSSDQSILAINIKDNSVEAKEKDTLESSDEQILSEFTTWNFHELPFSELVKQLQQVWSDKQQLKKVIRDFEDEFVLKNGYKPSKKDKSELDLVYETYKDLKCKFRLLEALISKYEKS